MAFTIEKLNEFFDQFQENTYPYNASFKQHPNYSIVVDYLTGKSQSLQGLTPTHENWSLVGLISFLEDIEQPSVNDKLLLDVISEPNIYPYLQHAFAQHLIWNAEHKNTPSALAAATAIFKKQGLSDDEIFLLFIHYLQFTQDNYESILSPGSEVRKYLISTIPKQLSYGNPNPGMRWASSWTSNWGNGWNALYLILLEEGRPELVDEYILRGLAGVQEGVAEFIINYKEGKYINTVLNWLKEPHENDTNLEGKFITAIRLYEKDNKQFQKFAVDISKKYLHLFQLHHSKDRWERNVQIKLLEGEPNSYIPYSAIAFHFLLVEDEPVAKELVGTFFKNKAIVSFDVLKVLFKHIKHEALPYLKLGLKADASAGGIDYYKRIIDLLITEFKPGDYIEILWELTSSKSKPLREHLAKLLAEKDNEAEQKAINLLQSKNAEARQTAALILSFFNTENALNAVKAILNVETNDNARDILLQIASASFPATPGKEFINEMIQAAASRSKLNKPIEAWLKEDELPPLYYKNGQQVEQLEVRFLLYRMSRTKAMRSDIEAKYIIDLLDKERAAPFAKNITKLFIDKGAKPEYKYLVALAALLGSDEIVDRISSVTNGWIEENRTKMAEYGIGALALQGSNKALRLVEFYSRKYKNKTASVGKAALQALEDAAEELNISTHELGDRIVPDFGFEDLFKHFNVNGEEYRAFIDSNFKLAFFDEDNKKLKALPTAASKELKEEFKNIAKEVREVVKSQSLRLEYYLIIQRRWNAEEWKRFYLTNPVMFIYATKLLWGKYDKEGNLLDCFMCVEDTSLINLQDDEIELDDDLVIGIVHPTQLDKETLQNWKQKFFDLSIQPIFPQLDRRIGLVPDADKFKKITAQFEGVETETGSIKSTLEKHGWRKGDTGDGGYIDHFRFQNTTNNTEAILEVEGVFVGGYGYDSEPKLGRLYFIDRKKDKAKWFITPKDDQDERLITLSHVDAIFYSEVVASVLSIKQKNKEAELA